MKQVLIFGGTGFIGLSLAKHLRNNNYTPIVIGRNKPKQDLEFEFCQWDANAIGDWISLLEDAYAVVNLAGKSVDCIKTRENRDIILNSRVNSTKAIGKAFSESKNYPKIWVQMSTAHIYGDPPVELHTESSPIGKDSLAPMVGKAWEEAFVSSKPNDVKGVILRTSFVIGKNGGALASLERIAKLGFGGTAGHGRQGMSWIHEYDMNEIIHQSIVNPKYKGIIIASSPNPVSNKEFMKTLRSKMKIPFGIPAPELITRIGAKFVFRTDPELVLYGRYVKSEVLETLGYEFKFPKLDKALVDLLVKSEE